MKLTESITGQISNLFQTRGETDPPALMKAIAAEVKKRKEKSDGVYVVPNDYTIFMCEEDCLRLGAARVLKDLYETVQKKVIREKCFMDGILNIRIQKNPEPDEKISVESKYSVEEKKDEDTINLENDVLSQTIVRSDDTNDGKTIVADKTKILSTMKTAPPKNPEHNIAVLTDSETGEIILGERQIYIGRKETNDFVLDDEGSSRIHAYISYERHRHILHDAGSLNGTFVNKKQIDRCELNHGDKILIGNTVLIYKVLD